MGNLVQSLISSLVPVLISVAEEAMGVKPNPQDSGWVSGLINEIVGLIQKYIPAWLSPSVQEIEQLVSAEVEKVLK